MSTCYNPFSLEGKTVLVTGASSGIGRATAIECSKAGAKLIIIGRNQERLQETFLTLEGDGHSKICVDLTDETGMSAMIAEIPVIDGCVLCAGRGLSTPVQFCTKEKFETVFNINFYSTAGLIALLYKKKKLKKQSSVVIIDSIGGVYRFGFGSAIYGSSKAALDSFMKFASREFAQRQVRVNCICPGMIETPLIHRGTYTDENLAKDKEFYLGHRYGMPEEVAFGAIYLLSDATKWVTGTNLVIDGGNSIY